MADRIQVSDLQRTSNLGDSDVFYVEQHANNKAISRSTTLGDLSEFFGTSGGGGSTVPVKASDVSYDNLTSELEAVNVQTAIDELTTMIRQINTAGLNAHEVVIHTAEWQPPIV